MCQGSKACHVLDSRSEHSGFHAVMGLVGFLKMSGIEVCHVLESKSEHNGFHGVMGLVGFLKMSMLQHYLLASIS